MSVVEGSTLTPAELVALVEADSLIVDAGLELLDADDVLIDDISDDLITDGSEVSLGIYNTIHRTCTLNISRELAWGWQRLRPYLLLSSDGTTHYRWNLGVFLPSVPERQVSTTPATWTVAAFDKLEVLNTPYGSAYSLAASTAILPAIEALITAAGESKIRLDQTAVATVTSGVRAFSLVDDWSTLGIVNDLLGSIGYEALSVDADGWFRAAPYRSPEDRSTVWAYDADSSTTTVAEERSSIADYWQAANVIVAISDEPDSTLPAIGAGIYTVTNMSDGPTSVDARGGRYIRRVIRGTYATQAALESAATEALGAEKRVANYVTLSVSPNPIHGHFDVVALTDSEIPVNGRFLVTNWELPLDGSDMSLSLRSV
jgi:hypothetical protein